MRRRTLLTTLAAGLTAGLALPRPAMAATANWADLELLDTEDRSFRLDQSTRPLTLVMLWANWCGICMRELDTVDRIVPAVGADQVEVVLLSHPNDWQADQALLRRRGLGLTAARPSPRNAASSLQSALLSADGTFYVPRALLFSRASGRMVWSHVGGQDWRRADATESIRRFAAHL